MKKYCFFLEQCDIQDDYDRFFTSSKILLVKLPDLAEMSL